MVLDSHYINYLDPTLELYSSHKIDRQQLPRLPSIRNYLWDTYMVNIDLKLQAGRTIYLETAISSR